MRFSRSYVPRRYVRRSYAPLRSRKAPSYRPVYRRRASPFIYRRYGSRGRSFSRPLYRRRVSRRYGGRSYGMPRSRYSGMYSRGRFSAYRRRRVSRYVVRRSVRKAYYRGKRIGLKTAPRGPWLPHGVPRPPVDVVGADDGDDANMNQLFGLANPAMDIMDAPMYGAGNVRAAEGSDIRGDDKRGRVVNRFVV